jgi:hypothetical protein
MTHPAVIAAIAQAIKASGAIVRVAPDALVRLVSRDDAPLVVRAPGGVFKKRTDYLAAHRSLVFFTSSRDPLALPGRTRYIDAGRMWIPG